MARLEELQPGVAARGLVPGDVATVEKVNWFGDVLNVIYRTSRGQIGDVLLSRDKETALEIAAAGTAWRFDGDGHLFRLMAESHRIGLAHLFDPLLAIHTSQVQPLPHQITAVYGELLPRQPLRFLLADDPGAGKTIMTGLFLKELLMRGDLRRCLICCPGNLAEQWEDELATKFGMEFLRLERAHFDNSLKNPFADERSPLVICRLDQLSRSEDVQDLLRAAPAWDVVVCDEAHKMSASFSGGELKETKRHQLGRMLGGLTRHLLLLTATPHNGHEEDFQLFLRLLDADRFEGKPRGGKVGDVSDLMRRMVKEQLVKFDNTPLFPERRAYTVTYELSPDEAALYEEVSDYVREEMNRAERLEGGQGNVVGFALTVLQRRLASSPAAIHQSLRRRRERLEKRLAGEEQGRGETALPTAAIADAEDFYDEAPDDEIEQVENAVVDRASASRTRAELEAEISSLRRLEALAGKVRASGGDRKWSELSAILQGQSRARDNRDAQAVRDLRGAGGEMRKLIIFTEHRDTLAYLQEKIGSLLGRPSAVVTIHGGLNRHQRRDAQEAFTHDRDALVLLATDAAGEGINLQCAHLMVNYDLPWNPNRIEQRFGRIHRIGQTEVCHLWNLVADKTREGDVFGTLLEKLDRQREALGGSVFDVLGQSFSERSLREMLVEAVRYGDRSDVKARLTKQIEEALDVEHLQTLIQERALTDGLAPSKVQEIRDMMERAEALRLQPHFIASYFRAAFEYLQGNLRERETRRYEIANVPGVIRQRARSLGLRPSVQTSYNRITFEKDRVAPPGKPVAAFVCPGHPLLEATRHLLLERGGDVLRQGAILVDEANRLTDGKLVPRALFILEHAVQDARRDQHGKATDVSRRLYFVEIEAGGATQNAGSAPYLDYRPLKEHELETAQEIAQAPWLTGDVEGRVKGFAIATLAIPHQQEVEKRVRDRVVRVRAAVQERLEAEIRYYNTRALELSIQERAGRAPGKLNSSRAKETADGLARRLSERLQELDEEGNVQSSSPNIIGGALIVPAALLPTALSEPAIQANKDAMTTADMQAARERIDRVAVAMVLATERALGNEPREMPHDNPGFDVESRRGSDGRLRFLEVKGKALGSDTVTISKTQILTCLNAPDDWILALVTVDGESAAEPVYIRRPFEQEPDFNAVSVNYNLRELLAQGGKPFS